MRLRAMAGIVVSVTGLFAGQLSAQQEPIERFIIEQLSCVEAPRVLPILLILESLGKIKADERIGYDSVSCFRIHGGIRVNGITFQSICGFEDSEAIRNLRPDLLWRGPGTSPSRFISFGTPVDFKIAQKWYFQNIGRRYLNQAIRTDDTSMGDNTEIRCSNFFRY